MFGLLAATAVLYLWGLGASGWANSFYSAAAQAGSQSWKALFFGSSDAANFITVDKPPASLWVMGLSVRLFGLSSWSILVPEALMGVACVGVLYATVKRWFGAAAGLLAGAVLALTPVATLMFRFNNPDAMLVLVLTIGAYCITRALEDARGRWLYLGFAMVGLGFLTKMLQAALVLPGFGLVYLIAAPTHFWRRVRQLAVACVVFVASFGWWVAIVAARALVVAPVRRRVPGQQHPQPGVRLQRLRPADRRRDRQRRWWRRQRRWPVGRDRLAANVQHQLRRSGLVAAARRARPARPRPARHLAGHAHRPHPRRTDPVGLLARRHRRSTFSLGEGIIHEYYTVALAPALGALVGIGGVTLWRRRGNWFARIGLAGVIGLTGWWTVHTAGAHAGLQRLAATARRRRLDHRRRRRAGRRPHRPHRPGRRAVRGGASPV